MGPETEKETPWFSKSKAWRVSPNPTLKNLREQCFYKAPKYKKKPSIPMPQVHQKRAHAPVAKPLTHATELRAFQAISRLPPSHTNARVVLQRYLGHQPALFSLPIEVSTELQQILEAQHTLANNMLKERHYKGNMYRNVVRHHKCQTRWYIKYARGVTRCYLTVLRNPTLK